MRNRPISAKPRRESINSTRDGFGICPPCRVRLLSRASPSGKAQMQRTHIERRAAHLRDKCRRRMLRCNNSARLHAMKVIAVYNVKGGVGKTAIALNLAAAAAKSRQRSLLWDLDEQGAASAILGHAISGKRQRARR